MYLYEGMTHAEKERIRLANLPVEEYIADFLESYKHNIAKTTYIHYKKMVDNRRKNERLTKGILLQGIPRVHLRRCNRKNNKTNLCVGTFRSNPKTTSIAKN